MVTALPALHIPTAAELAEITDGVTAHDTGLVDAVKVTVNPIITAAAFATETDIPRLALSGQVVSGSIYLFTGQLMYSHSVTDSEFALRIRHTTPVTGTLIGYTRLSRAPYANAGRMLSWAIPWSATWSGAGNWYASIQRTSGTATANLEGGDEVWSTMTLLARSGTIRVVST